MRYVFGLFTFLSWIGRFLGWLFRSWKFILVVLGIWLFLATLGTGWTLLIAYFAAAFALFKMGPADKQGAPASFTLMPTRGSPYALIAPLGLVLFFPLVVIAMLGKRLASPGQ